MCKIFSFFSKSNLGFAITNNLLKLPEPETLAGFDKTFPKVFVADDAFPMRHNLIKPYSNPILTHAQKIANNRISIASRIIENTIGIMAARFRIFRRPIVAKVETVESTTKACVGLHNYLMKALQMAIRIVRLVLLTRPTVVVSGEKKFKVTTVLYL